MTFPTDNLTTTRVRAALTYMQLKADAEGYCPHAEVIPVESAGEVVARLCLTCDAQLAVTA